MKRELNWGYKMSNALLLKIIALGDAGTGKTSLIRKFAEGFFTPKYLPTLGVDITTTDITIDGKKIKLLCFDTAGQEHFGRLRPQYFKGANAAILVYDITSRPSFESLEQWYQELVREVGQRIPAMIVGNKVDLAPESRQVDSDEGHAWAKDHECFFVETSAKEDPPEKIKVIFETLAKKVLEFGITSSGEPYQ